MGGGKPKSEDLLYFEDTEDLGAEHSEGAVEGGVEVGVKAKALGSRPRL